LEAAKLSSAEVSEVKKYSSSSLWPAMGVRPIIS